MSWREEWDLIWQESKATIELTGGNWKSHPRQTTILAMDTHVRKVEAENNRLREAIEWALHEADRDKNYDWVMTELRRRAEGGK